MAKMCQRWFACCARDFFNPVFPKRHFLCITTTLTNLALVLGGFHGSQTRASESSIRVPMKQLELSARVLEVGLSSSYSPISKAPRNLNRPVTLRDFEVDRSIVTMEGLRYHVRHPSAYASAPDRCNSTDDFCLVKSMVSLRLLLSPKEQALKSSSAGLAGSCYRYHARLLSCRYYRV